MDAAIWRINTHHPGSGLIRAPATLALPVGVTRTAARPCPQPVKLSSGAERYYQKIQIRTM